MKVKFWVWMGAEKVEREYTLPTAVSEDTLYEMVKEWVLGKIMFGYDVISKFAED